ncbi:MAG: hypothetical protein V1492_04730 [Candidatus Micrarchaeota archaeon]
MTIKAVTAFSSRFPAACPAVDWDNSRSTGVCSKIALVKIVMLDDAGWKL